MPVSLLVLAQLSPIQLGGGGVAVSLPLQDSDAKQLLFLGVKRKQFPLILSNETQHTQE